MLLLNLTIMNINEIREDIQRYEDNFWYCFWTLVASTVVFAFADCSKLALLTLFLAIFVLIIEKLIRIADLCLLKQDFSTTQCLWRVTFNMVILFGCFYVLYDLVIVHEYYYQIYIEFKNKIIELIGRLDIWASFF